MYLYMYCTIFDFHIYLYLSLVIMTLQFVFFNLKENLLIQLKATLTKCFIQIQLKRALGKKTIFAMFHAQTMKIIAEKEIKFMTLEENKARK